MKLFHDEIKSMRKSKVMRLQINNEFQQVRIKDLNDQSNVEIFTTFIRGGKAFAPEHKIRELKARISKLNAQKLKIPSTKIILNTVINMSVKSEKYGLSPEEIGKKSLSSERFITIFDMHRIEKIKLLHDRLNKCDKKEYSAKGGKLRENSNIGQKVLVLAERKNQLLESFTRNLYKILFILIKKRSFLLERGKK